MIQQWMEWYMTNPDLEVTSVIFCGCWVQTLHRTRSTDESTASRPVLSEQWQLATHWCVLSQDLRQMH
jgi:hypothetical protein